MPVAKKVKKSFDIEKLKIETVSIDSLKLWKDNPRKNDEAVPKLAELLKIHGQRTPVVAWKKNNVVYKGNTTWKALKLIGAKTINVILADFPSENAAIAYGISDNKSSEFSEWDSHLLYKFLTKDTTISKKSGFTLNEIDLLELDGIIDNNEKLDINLVSKIKSFIKSDSVDIIRYAVRNNKIITITDLNTFISFNNFDGENGIIDLELTAKNLPDIMDDLSINDFPLIPDSGKGINIPISVFNNISRYSVFCGEETHENLKNVMINFSDNILIVTDGTKAIIKTIQKTGINDKISIRISDCRVINELFPFIVSITLNEQYLIISGDLFTARIKIIREPIPDMRKVIQLSEKEHNIPFNAIFEFINSIKSIQSCISNDRIYLSDNYFAVKLLNGNYIKIQHKLNLSDKDSWISCNCLLGALSVFNESDNENITYCFNKFKNKFISGDITILFMNIACESIKDNMHNIRQIPAIRCDIDKKKKLDFTVKLPVGILNCVCKFQLMNNDQIKHLINKSFNGEVQYINGL